MSNRLKIWIISGVCLIITGMFCILYNVISQQNLQSIQLKAGDNAKEAEIPVVAYR